KSFISSRPEGEKTGEGDIVNATGEIVGRHKGYVGYTIGQRKGLGISAPRPLYVTGIDPELNRVIVGEKSGLYAGSLTAMNVNWYAPPEKLEGVSLTARIRSRAPDVPAIVTATGEREAKVEFMEPQLSVTPGQAVVFYHDDFVVGGGWIDKAYE
ncbi:tRNA-specific 2-thiouridylase MnmA, partial [hydrothermal vent metagenome]